MVKNMKTTLTEKINWTKYNLAYPELGDVIQMIRTGDMQLHDNEFGDYTLKQAIEHIRSVALLPASMYSLQTHCQANGRQYIIIGGEKAYVDLLVAETFLVNPDPKAYTEVEHIDGNMSNNAADNLRWIKKQ